MPIDRLDRRILAALQRNAALSNAELADQVGLSPTPCWRRVRRLEEAGYVDRRVALLNRARVNLPTTVFVSVRTSRHDAEWLKLFHEAVADLPEVTEFYRMSGDVDYILKVAVPNIAAYDAFYKRLISRVPLSDVSSSFAMEEIKMTTELPLDYLAEKPL